MVNEGSSSSTTKLNCIAIIPIYIFSDKQHCLMNIATALLVTDCSITVFQLFMEVVARASCVPAP